MQEDETHNICRWLQQQNVHLSLSLSLSASNKTKIRKKLYAKLVII